MASSTETSTQSGRKAVATSSPGGAIARQYRVQYRAGSRTPWQCYAACLRPEQAEQCRVDLERRGYRTRLISYRLCPVAA
jgi:hypothetical protein